jgi:C4-dicarboxylate-specific signal transduction histidine kinase
MPLGMIRSPVMEGALTDPIAYVAMFRNVAAMLVLVFFTRILRARATSGPLIARQALLGLLYSAVIFAGMQAPFEPTPGVRIDTRTPLIALAGLLGSWPAALISMVMGGAFRAAAGGSGVVAGLAAVLGAGAAGSLAHRSFQQSPLSWGIVRFVLFGLVIASLGLAVGLLLPRELVAAFFRTYTLPTIGIFTLTVAAIGLFERNELLRERQARQLSSTNDLLATAERLGHLGSWQVEPRTGRVQWSPEMLRILDAEAPPQGTAFEVFERTTHPSDLPMMRARLQRLREGRADEAPVEYRMLRADGSVRCVWSRALFRTGADGRSGVLVGFVQDVTAQREAQAQLVRATRLASLGELAAGVGHEINNPLTIVQAQAARLLRHLGQSGSVDALVRESVDRINDCVRRVGKITHALRSYSRQQHSRSEDFDLRPLTLSTIALFRDLTPSAAIAIEANLQDAPVLVSGDPDRLQQVLLNLLLNAFHATEHVAKPQIEVQVGIKDAAAVILVTDNGTGVAPENRSRISDAFFTTKEPGRGTGLGLSISQNYVRDMGGTLDVAPDSLSGATFRVTLPAGDAGQATPLASS